MLIRRQARVMAEHNTNYGITVLLSSTSQNQSSHIQSTVIKTMILISVLYVIFWTPNYNYSLLLHFKTNLILTAHHARSLDFSLSSPFVIPFIHALKFYPVRLILVSLIPWKKSEASG